MSLSAGDITELLELWEELNLTDAANASHHVEAVVCSGAVGHAAFLHFLSVLYVFVFVFGLAANGLVLAVALRCERNLFAVNLAAADLLVVSTLPVWVASLQRGGRWPLGAGLCKLTHLVFTASLFASVFFLACLSADRYLNATRPSAPKRASRRLVCILVWVLALMASVPDTYFLQTVKSWHHDGGGVVCRAVYPAENPRAWMAGVQLSFITLGFAVPFPVMAVFYLLLGAAVADSDPAAVADSDRGAARRILLAYVLAFVACWLPFHAVLLMDTLALLNFLPFSCRLENFLGVALHLTQALSLVHCCLSPALYGLLNRRYHRVKDAIFRYSTKTGLTRLLDSDAEGSAGDNAGNM